VASFKNEIFCPPNFTTNSMMFVFEQSDEVVIVLPVLRCYCFGPLFVLLEVDQEASRLVVYFIC